MDPKSVMVCEDNELIREVLCCALRIRNFSVAEFGSADEALNECRDSLAQFDVVITDYEMPGIKGDVFAKHMRSLNPISKIILTSGYFLPGDDEVRHEIEFLPKPYSVTQIVMRLNELDSQQEPGQIAATF